MNVSTRSHPKHSILTEVRACTICMERFWRAMEALAKLPRIDRRG